MGELSKSTDETSKVFSFRTRDEKTINALNKISEKSDFLSDLMKKYFAGEFIDVDDIENKIKYQKYLKLCLENWDTLKKRGNIFEEAKAILLEQKQLEAPSVSTLLTKNPNEERGLDQFGGCFTCHHKHAKTEPRVCTGLSCNCGVRG